MTLRIRNVAILVSVAMTIIAKCTAFAPQSLQLTSFVRSNYKPPSKSLLAGSANKDNNGVMEQVLESLPSPDVIMENVLDGKFGERGEQYVVAQFSLFLFIAIGNIPFIGDTLTTILGPLLIGTGLIAVYKASSDLKDNLSPWPVPADPQSGRGSLVKSGIYAYVRHPMYTGVLMGMTGLSIITDSVARLLLTCALYYVLDVKSEYEEEKLKEIYGSDYEIYKQEVSGKFFPADLKIE